MNASEVLSLRLHNQLLAESLPGNPALVVARMGAMQSQTLDLAKWGIGVRLDGKTENDVDEALNTGKIIRTHILRPTWHFVSAEDIYWMNALSYPRLKPVYQSYCKTVGADVDQVNRLVPVLEKTLQGGKHLTKQELADSLRAQNIEADDTLLKLAIYFAELEGILCNGKLNGKKQTYTLLEEWVPRKPGLQKEEALERLARTYFTSHAPATLTDFSWWSGLSLGDCRKGLEAIQGDLVCEKVNGRVFWLKNDIPVPCSGEDSALLLPPFDEFVVSYKDRSELIEAAHYSKVMTKNGLFAPTVMLNGEIVGTWKRVKQKDTNRVELVFFGKMTKKKQELFKPAVRQLEQFWKK